MNKELLKKFQQSWAQNKYWVMSRRQQAYNEIRQLAKNNDWDQAKQDRYEEILRELEAVEPTTKTLTVAYQHIWGYFKKQASEAEKEKYKYLLENIAMDNVEMDDFLKQLSEKYKDGYLMNIRWPNEN